MLDNQCFSVLQTECLFSLNLLLGALHSSFLSLVAFFCCILVHLLCFCILCCFFSVLTTYTLPFSSFLFFAAFIAGFCCSCSAFVFFVAFFPKFAVGAFLSSAFSFFAPKAFFTEFSCGCFAFIFFVGVSPVLASCDLLFLSLPPIYGTVLLAYHQQRVLSLHHRMKQVFCNTTLENSMSHTSLFLQFRKEKTQQQEQE